MSQDLFVKLRNQAPDQIPNDIIISQNDNSNPQNVISTTSVVSNPNANDGPTNNDISNSTTEVLNFYNALET